MTRIQELEAAVEHAAAKPGVTMLALDYREVRWLLEQRHDLREALVPFALTGASIGPDMDDEYEVTATMTVGEIRAARGVLRSAALAESEVAG